MSELGYVVTVVVGGFCLLGLLGTVIVALCLNRGMRTQAQASLGDGTEARLDVNVEPSKSANT